MYSFAPGEKSIEYNIRGGLGNQVLELLGCLGTGTSIDKIYVNWVDNDLPHNKIDWISQVFRLPFPVIHRNNIQKFDVWHPARMELIFQNSKKLSLLVDPLVCHRIVQVRASDRDPVTREQYLKVICKGDILVGENLEATAAIAREAGVEWSPNDAIYNWRLCLGAKEIISPISAFTLSASILRGNKLSFFREQDGPIPVPTHAINSIDHIKQWMPQFTWINYTNPNST